VSWQQILRRHKLGQPTDVDIYTVRQMAVQVKREPRWPRIVRPKTYGDCLLGPRPCPFIGCRYNLLSEVSFAGGLRLRRYKDGMETCALDMANKGGMDTRTVARVLGLGKNRILQISADGMEKMRTAEF
jgi:hypothetical protein